MHPALATESWYFVPAYLMTALLAPIRISVAALVVHLLAESVSRRAARLVRPGMAAAGAAALLAAADVGRPFQEVEEQRLSRSRTWTIASYAGAQVINRVLPEGSVVGAWDAGVIGYFSHVPVVNLDGLVNSYEYARAGDQQSLWRRFGITHFANVHPVDLHRDERRLLSDASLIFEGAATSGLTNEGTDDGRVRAFKLWSTGGLRPVADGGGRTLQDRAAWFWKRMEPAFRWDDVGMDIGMIREDGLAQVFVRNCDPERLPAFFWSSRAGGLAESASWPWRGRGPRVNRLGACVTLDALPAGARRVEPWTADEWVAHLVGHRQPAIHSTFDVYHEDGTLLYVAEGCSQDDMERRFFVHVVPADLADLSRRGRREGFDNRAFEFRWRGVRAGRWCVAEWPLPAYRIQRITTGQFVPGSGRVWGGNIDLR